MSQRISIGFRSGECEGQSVVSVPSSSRNCPHTRAPSGRVLLCNPEPRSPCITISVFIFEELKAPVALLPIVVVFDKCRSSSRCHPRGVCFRLFGPKPSHQLADWRYKALHKRADTDSSLTPAIPAAAFSSINPFLPFVNIHVASSQKAQTLSQKFTDLVVRDDKKKTTTRFLKSQPDFFFFVVGLLIVCRTFIPRQHERYDQRTPPPIMRWEQCRFPATTLRGISGDLTGRRWLVCQSALCVLFSSWITIGVFNIITVT